MRLRQRLNNKHTVGRPNQAIALDRAGMTVFRDMTFLAAGPASERSRQDKTSLRTESILYFA
jgi:hypothetical protein